jgi:hypothetical protein
MPSSLQILPYELPREGLRGFRVYSGGTALSRKPVPVARAIQQAKALIAGGKAEEVKEYALSDSDIHRIIPTLKVIPYPELLRARSIDDVLDEKGRVMLLYLTENQNTGHWICCLKYRDQPVLEFFDPYGHAPDKQSEWLDDDKLEEFGQDTFQLSKLLRKSPYKVIWNKTKFQKDKMDINTCGRHCLCRLYLKHLTLPQYTKLVKSSGVSPDDFVSGFTFNLIGR